MEVSFLSCLLEPPGCWEKWFCRSASQKEAHLRKVSHSRVAAVSMPTCSVFALQGRKLSVDAASASKGTCVPQATIEAIWVKAKEYLNTPGDITGAPGCSPHSRMIKSRSGSRPHLVKQDKGSFVCDDMCGHWKGLGICSHSVVVEWLPSWARDDEEGTKLDWTGTQFCAKRKRQKGGRKGAKPPRKHSKPQPIEERVPGVACSRGMVTPTSIAICLVFVSVGQTSPQPISKYQTTWSRTMTRSSICISISECSSEHPIWLPLLILVFWFYIWSIMQLHRK